MEEDQEKSHDSAHYHGSGINLREVFMSGRAAGRRFWNGPGSSVENTGLRGDSRSLIWGAGMGYRFGREIFCPAAMSGEPGTEVQITVTEEDTVSDIAAVLEEKG